MAGVRSVATARRADDERRRGCANGGSVKDAAILAPAMAAVRRVVAGEDRHRH